MGEHDHRRVLVNGLRQLFGTVDQAQGVTLLQHLRQAFGDVQVGGEVTRFADDHSPLRRPCSLYAQGSAQHLEQVDRGGIGHHDFTLPRADQTGQAIAQSLGQLAPACAVPAADQAIAPFLGDHRLRPRQCSDRPRAQGIAIEIDNPFGERKLLAQGRQRVLGIKRQTIVSCRHRVSCFLLCDAIRAGCISRFWRPDSRPFACLSMER
ncbi:hypothetical protein D3C72_1468610 [compost metagenome]